MTGAAARGGFAALDPCVHCGFCLQACPTFLATGDEADGPRGRIELMRALEAGLLSPADPALQYHLDRCLGCRGCEPVCPSGVGYGRGLEAARERVAEVRPVDPLARLALWLLTTPGVSRFVYAAARVLRATGIPRRLAGSSRFGFSMAMLAVTSGEGGRFDFDRSPLPAPQHRALLFTGCVMDGLFSHVHAATTRTLGANGFAVRVPPGQACCGALHVHAGLPDRAREMARRNLEAFGDGAEPIVVNSAGCGALLKDYAHLLPDSPEAARFAARVRDVTELLADAGPVPGGPLELRVAYDPPCHLLHAQRVADAPGRVFAAVAGLTLVPVADAEKCCGSAGLYTVVEPDLSRTVLAAKVARLEAAAPDVVATGNPGCLMQIGAGLLASGRPDPVPARHPVEILDDAYRAAGRY
ncbi:MAG TPA: heterodisulfide reductase-related iron-sulfur binding cluster [Gemmatimonadales bacterium]|nr:heterodisulfide reductase-related iron-sulfur binding cluster [Gemmatimonadales bacterium]